MHRVRLAVFVGLGLFAGNCALADDDFRCMVSTDARQPVRLQFVFPAGESDTGRVVYEGGSGAMSVKRKSERTVERAPDGRPWVFESVWLERIPDGGRYIIQSQGAVINSFKYVRGKDGKVFRFDPDPSAEGDDGCAWNKARR